MNSNLFNTDYQAVAKDQIRPKHRATNQSPWFKALVLPLVHLNRLFYRFRESAFYQLQHDSRKISIEKVLNDSYDNNQRRIYIENVIPKSQPYLYEKDDQRPLYLYEPEDEQPVYLTDNSAVELNTINFTVFLPVAIQAAGDSEQRKQNIKINSLINLYKLAGKNHSIQWVSL